MPESMASEFSESASLSPLASEWNAQAHKDDQEQPDVGATELGNLEKLLTIDDNCQSQRRPSWNRTEKSHDEKDQGRGVESGDDTFLVDGGPIRPKQVISTRPQDPSLHHVRSSGVEFEDLWYTVVKKQKKDGVRIKHEAHLLQGITGAASKGEVTAVMGPSGAGKSTLLDALAGRIASGSLGGTTTVDGVLATPTLMKRMSAYVMQDDQLFPVLTVWETLWFAAEVRLHRGISRDEKRDRVTKLLDQLGLTKVQNTYIGGEKLRGISGGEKRRVSIGVDIIHGPALLFMDEPTSGLDSSSAYNVIEKVHDIAKAGSTVILTIHQPSFRILRFFNRLIVLARGQLIYQGGPNYLSIHLAGFGRQVPRAENPIEYLLDIIQEFDNSAHGVEPLVLYNQYGTKFSPYDSDSDFTNSKVITPVSSKRPSVSEYTQSITPGSSKRPSVSENMQSITPLSSKRPSVSEYMQSITPGSSKRPSVSEYMQSKGQSPIPGRLMKSEKSSLMSKIMSPFRYQSKSNTHDDAVEAMEVGYGQYDSMDYEFDHSINRTPKLASHFYKGLLDSLADRFLTPTSFMSPRTSTTLSPMMRTGLSPMQRRTMNRTASSTPLRSPSMTPKRIQEEYVLSSETSPTTVATNYKPGSSVCIAGEKEYVLHDEKFANIWWREVVILMLRNLRNFQRTPEHFMSRQIVFTVFACLLATLFLKVRHHLSDLDGVNTIMSFFMFTVTVFFFSSNDQVPAFIMERLIYIRETSHNAYRASSYVIANAIVSVPFIAIQALSFLVIIWWALGFQYNAGIEAFFFFLLILVVSLLCTTSFVIFISAAVPNYVLGYVVVITFTSLFFLANGFFIRRKQIPAYWIWLHYISTLKYPYEAMMLNKYGDPNNQVCYFYDPVSAKCSLKGQDLLDDLGITQLTKWESLAVLGAMGVFYRVMFYCVLRFGTKNQRS